MSQYEAVFLLEEIITKTPLIITTLGFILFTRYALLKLLEASPEIDSVVNWYKGKLKKTRFNIWKKHSD